MRRGSELHCRALGKKDLRLRGGVCCIILLLSSMIFLWLKAEGLDLLRMRDDDYGKTLRLNHSRDFRARLTGTQDRYLPVQPKLVNV